MICKKVDIVLATYNGEKFINEQLVSIINNEGFDDLVNEIIISDDQSTDSTVDIISGFIEKEPRIKMYTNKIKLNSSSNFSNAISFTSSPYVIFSDQDDVWEPDKLKLLFDGIVQLDSSKPGLYFSDLSLIDSSGKKIGKSFHSTIGTSIKSYLDSNQILLRNAIPGCSMIVNRKLVEICYPFCEPKGLVLHDWWMVFIAKYYGNIEGSARKLTRYRLHEHNVVGIKKENIFVKIYKAVFAREVNFGISLELFDVLIEDRKLKNPDILESHHSINSRYDRLIFMYNNKIYFNRFLSNVKLIISLVS